MTAEPIQIAEAAQQRKAFRRDGMGYRWTIDEHDVELHADYLSAKSEEFHAEIEVTRRGRHIHLARFNLSSTTSRASLAKALNTSTEGLEIPWPRLVEQFSVAVMRSERRGEPTQYTGQVERRPVRYLIDSLVIDKKTNMLFAPGGSGKGMLCVGLCCSVAAKRAFADLTVMEATPFYFDWEDDFETFEDRLNAVAQGMGVGVPKIAYRRMRGLVSDHINEMARAISDEGATFGIIDSFSAAGGTISDRAGWDTIAHRLFDALDQVPGMTWLIVDHVAGDRLKDPVGKAFGSIQKMNRVRNAWEMRSEQEPGSRTVHMRLFHAKWNHTGRKKPIGICMEFSGETVTVDFSAEDPVEVGAAGVPNLADRMAVELVKGALSTAVLAQVLNAKESSVRAEMARNAERFARNTKGFVMLRPPAADEPPEELPW